MIIENFIEWYTNNDNEREEMKECAFDYINECHYDELEQFEEKKEVLTGSPRNTDMD